MMNELVASTYTGAELSIIEVFVMLIVGASSEEPASSLAMKEISSATV